MIDLSIAIEMVFEVPEDDGEEIEEHIQNAGYESYYFINNLGSMFVIFVITIIISPLLYAFWSICKSKSTYARKKHASLHDALHGNIMLRFFMEACLDICISFFLQVYFTEYNGGLFPDNGNAFLTVNSVAAILMTAAVVIIIALLFTFYYRNFSKWGEDKFDARFGAVFDGLRKDSKTAMFYPLIFILRRLIFALTSILLMDFFFWQVLQLLVFSTLAIAYLLAF